MRDKVVADQLLNERPVVADQPLNEGPVVTDQPLKEGPVEQDTYSEPGFRRRIVWGWWGFN